MEASGIRAQERQMEMKVWLPPQAQKGPGYAVKQVVGVLALVGLGLATAVGAIPLALYFHWPVPIAAFFGCVAATALCIWGAVCLGRSAGRDALIFFQIENNRMFVLDVRSMVRYRRGLAGYIGTAAEVQKYLAVIRKEMVKGRVPSGAGVQITAVENIRERANSYALVCRVLYRNGNRGRRTYILAKGYEDEEELLQRLELKMPLDGAQNPPARLPIYAVLCAVALTLCIVLCLFSHPALALLPQAIYFPALALALALLYALVWLLMKWRRGE